MDVVYSTIAEQLDKKLNEASVVKKYGRCDFIDLFNDQFSLITNELVLPIPAILIEIGFVDWKTMSQKTQKGDAVVKIHIGQQTLADSYWNSDNKQTALKVLQYLKVVHNALQDLSGDNFNKLDRVSSEPDLNHTNLIVHAMTYSTNITEVVPVEVIEKNVTLEIVKGGIPAKVKGNDFHIPT